MKKGLAIGLIITGSILVIAAADVGISFAVNKANATTETYELDKQFNALRIDVSTSDIELISTTDNYAKVVCKETKKRKHTVSVEDNTLNITFDYKQSFNFLMIQPSYKVSVYLPSSINYDLNVIHSTGDLIVGTALSFHDVTVDVSTGLTDIRSKVTNNLKVTSSTGDIYLADMKPVSIETSITTGSTTLKDIVCSENIQLRSSTGDKSLSNVKAKNLSIKCSTGDAKLDNVIVSEKLDIDASTGKVKISNSDAGEIDIKTSTGDVTAEFLTSKIVYAKTDTGNITVPKSTSGGMCSIETSTGDIKVTFKQ